MAVTSNYDSKGIQNILDLEVTTLHQRCPLIFGCKRDIDIIIEEYRNVAAKLGTALAKPTSGPRSDSSGRVYTTWTDTLTTNNTTKARHDSSRSIDNSSTLDDKTDCIV